MLVLDQHLQLGLVGDVENNTHSAFFDDITRVLHLWHTHTHTQKYLPTQEMLSSFPPMRAQLWLRSVSTEPISGAGYWCARVVQLWTTSPPSDGCTYLPHGAVVGVPHHEDRGGWREELLQTLVAGQGRVHGFNVLKASRHAFEFFLGRKNEKIIFSEEAEYLCFLCTPFSWT